MDELILKVTAKEMDIIGVALGNRPYIEVAQLLQKISQQVMSQKQPAQALPPPNGSEQAGALQ